MWGGGGGGHIRLLHWAQFAEPFLCACQKIRDNAVVATGTCGIVWMCWLPVGLLQVGRCSDCDRFTGQQVF